MKQGDIIVGCSPSMSGWNCEVCGKRQEKGSECWHDMDTKEYFCGDCAKRFGLIRLGTREEIEKEMKERSNR